MTTSNWFCWPVEKLQIKGSAQDLASLQKALPDVLLAGSAEGAEVATEIIEIEGDEHFSVEVTLAENLPEE